MSTLIRYILCASLIALSVAGRGEARRFSLEIGNARVIIDDSDPRFLGADLRAPQYCPYDENWLCFEARSESGAGLFIYNEATAEIWQIEPPTTGGGQRFGGTTGGGSQSIDFNWRPIGSGDDRWFVFSSNAGGSFDLWLGEARSKRLYRIPEGTPGKNEKGPKWSPDGELIAYVTDASGDGDIYVVKFVRKLMGDPNARIPGHTRVIDSPGLDYEIRWYPGPASGYFAYTHQDPIGDPNRQVEIRVCDITAGGEPSYALKDADRSQYLRSASWNPNGRPEFAFYLTSQYPEPGVDVVWGVGMAHVDLRDPSGGDLELSVKRPGASRGLLVLGVRTSEDLQFGPPWTADGRYLVVTKTIEEQQNPMWLYDPQLWEMSTRHADDAPFAPSYKFPHDVSINERNISFVYSDGTSRKLLTASLSGPGLGEMSPPAEWPLVTPPRTKDYNWKWVDEPGFFPKAIHWASQPLFQPNFGLNSRGVVSAAVVGTIIYFATKPNPPPPPGETWNPPGFGQ